MAKKRRIWALVLGIVGILLVIGSFLWRSLATDQLVKYPDDVDETPVYTGTLTLYVDPATAAPLPTPQEVPLEVRRHVQVVESTSELAVVHETLNLSAAPLIEAVQENQYVMDRKTMLNVADDRAWAFDQNNVVDRSGAYRLNFPLDNESVPYPIYLNETETTYDATPDEAQPTGTIEGLDVHNFQAQVPYTPVTETYLAALDTALPQPLPRELGLEQLNPLLAAAGIDIPGLLPALLPALNEADRETIIGLAQQPVKLQYLLRNSGEDSVEVNTGGIVEVRNVEQNFAAAPDPALVPQLNDLLGRYTQVPGVSEAIENLGKLAAEPIKIFDNRFTQTPESITEIAGSVRDLRDLKSTAEETVPLVLLIAGIVLGVVGLGIFAFWPKRPKASSTGAELADNSERAGAVTAATGASAVDAPVVDPPPVEPPVDAPRVDGSMETPDQPGGPST
jgi:hypothetical protein